MATKEQIASSEEMDPCQVRSTALGAFERTHGRTQGGTVKRRPSQPASHAVALAGPRSPSLPACAMAVICGRTWSARSNALPAFEHRPVTCQSINRTLGPFYQELFVWASFGEQFCHCRPCFAPFLCNPLFYLMLMLYFSSFMLPYHMGG
jgi:hypothetical protein